MLCRNSRGRPLNAPAAFIHPCQPTVAKEPPSGPGWELKHDGYRLQIHVRDGRLRLFTMNGNDWTKRYPRIVEEAARLRAPLIIYAEVVHLSADGVFDFDSLHSRTADEKAVALAFDLLLAGEDIRRQPLIERKTALKWVLRKARERVSSMLSTLRATATNFLPPFAISGLRASSRSSLRRFIDRVRHEHGLRSKIRSHPLQPGPSITRSSEREGSCCHFANRWRTRVRTGSKYADGEQG